MNTTKTDSHAEWYQEQDILVRRAREEREEAERLAIRKLEAQQLATRAKRAVPAAPPPVPLSGRGYHILATPYEPLARLVHDAWGLSFHAIPWPSGWTVRWANLNSDPKDRLSRALGTVVLGLCVRDHKLLLFDETENRKRTWREFLDTVLHELVHITHLKGGHGSGFTETLDRVLAHVLPEDVGFPSELKGVTTKEASMATPPNEGDEWEFAALRRDNGTPLPRTKALKSLAEWQRARAAAGGHAPPTSPAAVSVGCGSGGVRVADAARQLAAQFEGDVAIAKMHRALMAKKDADTRRERAAAERREREGLALFVRAPEESLSFLRRFLAGAKLSPRPSMAECIGKQLHAFYPHGPGLTETCARVGAGGTWWRRREFEFDA